MEEEHFLTSDADYKSLLIPKQVQCSLQLSWI